MDIVGHLVKQEMKSNSWEICRSGRPPHCMDDNDDFDDLERVAPL